MQTPGLGRVIGRWLRTVALTLAVVSAPLAGRIMAPVAGGATVTLVATAFAGDAEARSRTSGGYSRPSLSSSPFSSSGSRTPSAAPSSSWSSGGYARPSTSSGGYAAPPASAGDRALNRQGSGDALGSYRSQQDQQRTPSAATSSSGGWSLGQGSQPGAFRYQVPPRQYDYYQGYGWQPPVYAYAGPRSFGMWDAVFMWFMLDTLSRPGHAAFFYNNQADPGYQQWRGEADRLARDNADLRAKLDQLDAQMAADKGQPRDPGRLPADVPSDMVRAPSAASGGLGLWGWIAVIAAMGVLLWLWRARRRMDSGPDTNRWPRSAAGPVNAPNPVAKEDSSVSMFGTLGNYVDRKLSGKAYTPSLFRLGMTVTIDPSAFLLAGEKIKVRQPAGSGLTSVEGVGTVVAGAATLYRLHLDQDRFLQLHLDAAGHPDECRYFQVIDEVNPADADEWGFWLDDAEGMIGWAEFQTKDGKTYPRIWTPGLTRVAPVAMTETVQRARGTSTVASHAMLYGAPTGLAAPAPATEYILVSAIEEGGQAWVQIAAGVDLNPASLSLA